MKSRYHCCRGEHVAFAAKMGATPTALTVLMRPDVRG